MFTAILSPIAICMRKRNEATIRKFMKQYRPFKPIGQ